jgi:Flp pilus assembly protein TadD
MKRLFSLAGLSGLLLLSCARAIAQDDQYVQVYNLIQEADALNNSNQPGQALARYTDARMTLQKFQRMYPDWNPKVVDFRLNYLASRITEMADKAPHPIASHGVAWQKTNAPVARPLQPQAANDLENQIGALQNLVRQLQADKQLLEAKLKEAFSAQPAAVDPGELAKAEERIRALEKENGLLQVTVAQQQTRAAPAVDAKTLDQMKRDLTEANKRIADQTAKANVLVLEKQTLQTRLDSLIPASWNASNLEAARKGLDEANRKLAQQTDIASGLAREKENLLARVKTLEADADVLTELHAENEILKKQLAGLKGPARITSSADATRHMAEAQARIAALESDKEILRLEKIALQIRVRQLSVPSVAMTAVPAARMPEDTARVKQLERERAELQKKLEAALKKIYGRKSKSAVARMEDLAGQLEVLHARLAVFEAQQIPYTHEERALFKESRASLAVADPRAGQKSGREMPSGTAALVAEARRDFSSKKFDRAEEKYIQILRKDEENVYTLANLAAIQLELNHLDEAEKHVRQALALSPDDSYSLLVLGQINFRREKYDEALDALSRASKLDSQNAEIQNFLGLTLSQKGMRSSAETAFRKAIQLDPNYGSAHHNLAVFYITQKPSWPELARWHYKKALDCGFPRNPDLEKMLGQGKAE